MPINRDAFKHWVENPEVVGLRKQDKGGDSYGAVAPILADKLEELGDPLAPVVRRHAAYRRYQDQLGEDDNPARPLPGGTSRYMGYLGRSVSGDDLLSRRAHFREPSFHVFHDVHVTPDNRQYHTVSLHLTEPEKKTDAIGDYLGINHTYYQAPVTKAELQEILARYGDRGQPFATENMPKAVRSRKVGEHPMAVEDKWDMARPEEYHESHRDQFGLDLPASGPGPVFDEALSRRTAAAYEKAKHLPQHPKVKASYDAMKREVKAQYDFLEKNGVKIEPWTREGQPYANSAEMSRDAIGNKHLYYFPTKNGYGQGQKDPQEHPLLEEVPDRPGVTYNDLFRAVHDYFGHAVKGHQFGPRGELQAYGEHARMFSPLARLALAAETHGQNSWVNFGPHSGLPVKERPYAEQKATILPKNAVPPVRLARQATPFRPLLSRGQDGSHSVVLPMRDGSTFFGRYNSFNEAKPTLIDWMKNHANRGQAAVLRRTMRGLAPGIPQARRIPTAKPLPVAQRVPGPKEVQYRPGVAPPPRQVQYNPGMPTPIRGPIAGPMAGPLPIAKAAPRPGLARPVLPVAKAGERPRLPIARDPDEQYGGPLKTSSLDKVGAKIAKIEREGIRGKAVPHKQAVAVALNMGQHHKLAREEMTHPDVLQMVHHIAAGKPYYDHGLDAVPYHVLADRLEELGDPLHAVVRRSPAFFRMITDTSSPHYIGAERNAIGGGMSIGADGKPVYYQVAHSLGQQRAGPAADRRRYHVASVSYDLPSGRSATFAAPVTKDEMQEILKHHNTRDVESLPSFRGKMANPRNTEHPMATEDKWDMARGEGPNTLADPEFLKLLQDGETEAAKNFLTRKGDPAAELLDPANRTDKESNDLQSFWVVSKPNAALKLTKDGTAELHLGPDRTVFRKKLPVNAIRRLVQFHRPAVRSSAVDPSKLARKPDPSLASSLATALRDVKSKRQLIRRQLARQVAQEAGLKLVGLSDAASLAPHPRAGVVQAYQGHDPDTVAYAAAWYGMLSQSPRLTVFHENPGGGDVLHVTKSPLGISQILDTAAQQGLTGVTAGGDGTVHVLDPGGKAARQVAQFLAATRSQRPTSYRGTAAQVGSDTGDPRQARDNYRRAIKNFQG